MYNNGLRVDHLRGSTVDTRRDNVDTPVIGCDDDDDDDDDDVTCVHGRRQRNCRRHRA